MNLPYGDDGESDENSPFCFWSCVICFGIAVSCMICNGVDTIYKLIIGIIGYN